MPAIQRSFSWTLLLGALILAAGVVLLLDQQGVLSADRVFNYFWPGVLIAGGIVTLVGCRGRGGRGIWGFIMLGWGILLVLSNLGIGHFRFESIWPIAVIGIGVAMIYQAMGRGGADGCGRPQWMDYVNPWSRSGSEDTDLNHVAIFGGFNKRVTTQNFRGGKLIALCGGYQIDLRKADIVPGETAVIEAIAVMGGGEIKVPENWLVSMDGIGIFGGYSDESHQLPQDSAANQRKLVVKGVALLGGVVVKN